jgi:hypothetical protein
VSELNNDLIQVKELLGELKLSQKRRGYGVTITTKEIIFQRPYLSYHVLFKDVISLHSISSPPKNIKFEVDPITTVSTTFGSEYYKLVASKVTVYSKNGSSEQVDTEFLVSLSDHFIQYFSKFSNLTAIIGCK